MKGTLGQAALSSARQIRRRRTAAHPRALVHRNRRQAPRAAAIECAASLADRRPKGSAFVRPRHTTPLPDLPRQVRQGRPAHQDHRAEHLSHAFSLMSASFRPPERRPSLDIGRERAIELETTRPCGICFPAQMTIGEAPRRARRWKMGPAHRRPSAPESHIGDCRLTHYAALLRKASRRRRLRLSIIW